MEDIKFKISIDGTEKSFSDVNKLKTELIQIEAQSGKSAGGLKGFASKSVESFKEAAGGVNVFGTTLSGVFKVILTNPIGIFISALTALGSILMKNADIADTVKGVFNGVMVLFDKFAGFLSGKFIEALNNPVKAFKDFGNAIVENIINRFKGFQVVLEGLMNLDVKKMTDGFLQIGVGVENVTDKLAKGYNDISKIVKNQITESINASLELGKIEEEEKNNAIKRAKKQLEIDSLLRQSKKDKTLTDKERIDLLIKAGEIEKNLSDDEVKIAKKREKLAYEEYQRKLKNGVDEDEAMKVYVDALNARVSAEQSAANIIEGAQIRIDNVKQAMADKELEAAQKRKEINDKEAKLREEENLKKNAELQAASEAAIKAELDSMQYQLDVKSGMEQLSNLERIADRKFTEEEIARIALMSKDEQLKYIQELKDADKAASDQKIKNANRSFSAVSGILSDASKLASEGSEEQKQLAIASTVINTYQAAQNAFTSLSEIPVVGVPLGIAAAAAAVASGLKNVQAIQNTPVPKYSKGGFIGGLPHSQGGTLIEAEKGEFIVNKNTMSDKYAANMIMNLNAMGNNSVINEKSNIINNDRTAINKVYVVESDITRVQNRINVIEQNSIIR